MEVTSAFTANVWEVKLTPIQSCPLHAWAMHLLQHSHACDVAEWHSYLAVLHLFLLQEYRSHDFL